MLNGACQESWHRCDLCNLWSTDVEEHEGRTVCFTCLVVIEKELDNEMKGRDNMGVSGWDPNDKPPKK